MRLLHHRPFRERVAQPVEHLTFNQEVPGSIPGALTNEIKLLRDIWPAFTKLSVARVATMSPPKTISPLLANDTRRTGAWPQWRFGYSAT